MSYSKFLIITLLPIACFAEDISKLFSVSKDSIVVSASKREEDPFKVSSAVYVLTSSDIKRSGANNIPDLLRLVPGIEVAQIDGNKWAITSRGFNRQFANKLLVLVDGRSIYTPLFSGVYWDSLDFILDDIERIEVIRGSGATIWGANAVNGVINIITKSTKITEGNFASFSYGTDGTISSYRHGNVIGNKSYRVYGKSRNTRDSRQIYNSEIHDKRTITTVGFKYEIEDGKNNYTIQGDAYKGKNGHSLLLPSNSGIEFNDENTQGGNLMFNFNQVSSDNNKFNLQGYVDYYNRDLIGVDQTLLTFDVEAYNNYASEKFGNIIIGAGYRGIYDDLETEAFNSIEYLNYIPDSTYENLFNVYIQSSKYLLDDKVNLTSGIKLEHNYYSGAELQPNLKLAFFPKDNQTVWLSTARSVRTPSRAENSLDLVIAESNSMLFRQIGNESYTSEDLNSYEIGYRIKPNENIILDLTAFYNNYNSIRTFDYDGTFNFIADNNAEAIVRGFDIVADWQVNNDWDIVLSYSYLDVDIDLLAGSTDIFATADEGTQPQNQFKFRSHYNLSNSMSFDGVFLYVDKLESSSIYSYKRLDLQYSWKPSEKYSFNFLGMNLLDNEHVEFSPALYSIPANIGRSLMFNTSIRF